MSNSVEILSCGPSVTVQDLGRPGYLAQGLTRGGAADMRAMHEGAALLRQSVDCAGLEMVGMGGTFRVSKDTRIALTGAPMGVTLDDEPLVWNASHHMTAGSTLKIGGAKAGTYGYLHFGGGIDSTPIMGSRATHLSAGLGQPLKSGTILPIGTDKGSVTGMSLAVADRFDGGPVRMMTSMQTDLFDPATRARFTQTQFKRATQSNRMGVRLDHNNSPFTASGQLTILSDVIVSGDIQITGDGAPFVLMCECQTTGGYPRIGTVIPCDLPRVAQAPAGATLTFELISFEEAQKIQYAEATALKRLRDDAVPLVRDPSTIRDLLGYQLVSGAISAMIHPLDEEQI